MLLDKLCRMGMTFVDPLTLRDNPKKNISPYNISMVQELRSFC